MPFPPVPALVLPEYMFFIIFPAMILLGVFMSLTLYIELKKWVTIILITLPILVITIISPTVDIMAITLLGYLAGFAGGSLVFYLEFAQKPK